MKTALLCSQLGNQNKQQAAVVPNTPLEPDSSAQRLRHLLLAVETTGKATGFSLTLVSTSVKMSITVPTSQGCEN